MNKSQKIVCSVAGIVILIIAWGLFPLFFKWLMHGIGSGKENLEDFGPLGDIYGSLNTLFTSATLIIVVYSTLLQRQANQDAKDAMVQQLQQARDATAQQLIQARKALDLQLAQAKDSTTQQLALAQASHDAQIKESQYAIFSNMFNNLLLHKNELKKNLIVINEGITYSHEYIFKYMSNKFVEKLNADWSDLSKVTQDTVLDVFLEQDDKLDEGSGIKPLLYTYFYIYESIIELVKSSKLTNSEKFFYYSLIGNTMSVNEQVCLLWISSGAKDIGIVLKGTGLFWFNLENHIEFIAKFNDKSCFKHADFLAKWDEFEEN